VSISRESVRRLRQALGLAAVHRRRPPQHRSRRPREQAAGQLVQVDGSPVEWLESRGPAMTLLGAIDDATSEILALHFRPTEDLHGYATMLRDVFRIHGLPVALYGDGVNILVRTDHHWSLEEQLAGTQAPTHLGRDGRVSVRADATVIAELPSPSREFVLVPHGGPSADRPRRAPRTARPLHAALNALATSVPPRAKPHPWRRAYNERLAIKAGYTQRWA
jgi:hypothetical protein